MWNILIGVFFIIGGLSGTYAIRGTNSTIGLAVLGAVLVVWGIIQVSSSGKSTPAPRIKRRPRAGNETPERPRRPNAGAKPPARRAR
ncbi:MAG: hypothetical protein AMXMBFR7_30010 [Planctomycetota bacterium]